MPKMNTVQMVRCEVTGKLYPADECEVVTVKIVKWKNADINNYQMFKGQETFVTKTEAIKQEFIAPIAKPVLDPASPEYNKRVHRSASVIPPAMKDLFKKPPELSQ